MQENLHDFRKSYKKGALSIASIDPNPMQQFRTWFSEAQENGGISEANAMTLSTQNKNGFPRGRVVLLKKYDELGFYFYTGYSSNKGLDIENNNKVCISFFWPVLERQIIIEGLAIKTSRHDSLNYFHSRPRGSQLGALASNQSSEIDSREALEQQLIDLEKEYEGKEIPKPENWGGYIIQPTKFEFWQGRPNRLHDRIQYVLKDVDWNITRLQP